MKHPRTDDNVIYDGTNWRLISWEVPRAFINNARLKLGNNVGWGTMGVLWQGDRLDPESIVMILERERRAWLEAANAFERLKPALVSGTSTQEVVNHIHACRARAEALKRTVQRLCDQYQLPSNFPDQQT